MNLDNRRRIYRKLSRNKWMTIPEIARAMSIGSTAVRRHLEKLEREDKVKSYKVKGRRYWKVKK